VITIKITLPYEIIKLFDTEIDPITGEKEISFKRNYAFSIDENFKTIIKYFNDLISGTNLKLDKDTADCITVSDGQEIPITRVKLGKIGTGIKEYGLAIYDASGNMLVSLYDPDNLRINTPIYIEPAYVKAWASWPAGENVSYHNHNLGYIPTHRNAEGTGNPVGINTGNVPAGESYIVPEEFYAVIDIQWVSKTRFQKLSLSGAQSGKCDQWRVRFLR
jgi:hypothetical protein